MYMHKFREAAAPQYPELKVGSKYHVTGYHTGDFTGECVSNDLRVPIFVVTRITSSLKPGEFVEVHMDSAIGAGVKIREA